MNEALRKVERRVDSLLGSSQSETGKEGGGGLTFKDVKKIVTDHGWTVTVIQELVGQDTLRCTQSGKRPRRITPANFGILAQFENIKGLRLLLSEKDLLDYLSEI